MLQIPTDFKDWALARLKEMNTQEVVDREQIHSNQRQEYDACIRKIDNLIDMRANSEIDENEFRGRKTTLLTEKRRLEAYLHDTEKRVENWLEVAERGFNFAEKAARAFAKASTENDLQLKKEIFGALGSNYTLKDGKLSISLDNLLFPIRKAAEEVRVTNAGLEPKKKRSTARQKEKIYSKNPRLLRDLDSNQDSLLQREVSYH